MNICEQLETLGNPQGEDCCALHSFTPHANVGDATHKSSHERILMTKTTPFKSHHVLTTESV
jgi:hypothetical protein